MTNEATPSINRINPPELGAPPAARAEVSKLYGPDFMIEIEAIAAA
jgi:enamine deaminase RidA (YjgF/YER057c/UK114 family)